MPTSAADFTRLLDIVAQLRQIIEGLQAQAETEAGRLTPASEPAARTTRLR